MRFRSFQFSTSQWFLGCDWWKARSVGPKSRVQTPFLRDIFLFTALLSVSSPSPHSRALFSQLKQDSLALHPSFQTGPVSWMCHRCSHTGPHTRKGSLLCQNLDFISEPMFWSAMGQGGMSRGLTDVCCSCPPMSTELGLSHMLRSSARCKCVSSLIEKVGALTAQRGWAF